MGIIEKQLEGIYIPIYQERMNIPYSKAKKFVKSIIKKLKQEAQKDGTYYLPSDYGDQLLEREKTDEKIKAMLSDVRKEGANDDDIRKYWNLHELERRIVVMDNNEIRTASFLIYFEESGSEEKALNKVRKNFPIYGDPKDTTNTTGDDRTLPDELRDRINIYLNKLSLKDADTFKEKIEKFSSFNAFIRNEIRNGKL